jgi:uncharacterized membrane protein
MFSLLAIGSAAFYGAADFFGGLAARRQSAISVVLLSQAAGIIPLAPAVWMLPHAVLSRSDLLYSVGAGLAGGAGVALLYRALAIGAMASVAPMTAIAACCIPLFVSVWMGERIARIAILGIAFAIVSIVLVSRQTSTGRPNTASPFRLPVGGAAALVSGVAIGSFFLALARTNSHAGLWPLLVARLVAVSLIGTLALARGESISLHPRRIAIPVLGGLFDVCATALYLLAAQRGLVSIVAPLTSLYPAGTVLLARVILRERLSPWQITGLGCGVAAIVLTSSSGLIRNPLFSFFF